MGCRGLVGDLRDDAGNGGSEVTCCFGACQQRYAPDWKWVWRILITGARPSMSPAHKKRLGGFEPKLAEGIERGIAYVVQLNQCSVSCCRVPGLGYRQDLCS